MNHHHEECHFKPQNHQSSNANVTRGQSYFCIFDPISDHNDPISDHIVRMMFVFMNTLSNLILIYIVVPYHFSAN